MEYSQKLNDQERRFEELTHQMADHAVINDSELYRKVSKQQSELSETVARRLVEVVGMVRSLDLKKPPSIAESIDWARALLLLGAEDIDADTFRDTMSIIVKHRTDLDTVAERVGVKLSDVNAPL